MPITSSLPPPLSRIHAWARLQAWLGRFTLANRILLATAFIPTGLVKVTGQRFTALPISDPVGFFFEALYRTGPYWKFIGAMQVVAALLILIPQTAVLGALLLVPVVLSIFLITWGIGFSGTVYVTAGMLLSAIYLVCWDADRVWNAMSNLLGARRGPPLLEGAVWIERIGWILGGAVGIAFFLIARGLMPRSLVNELFYVGLTALVMVLVGWVIALRRQKT